MKNEQARILVPIITPFKSDETVDHDALAKLVRYLLDQGADGIYAGGSSAECFLLTHEERKETLETVMKAADGAFVVANIGTVGNFPAEDLARHAEKQGADAIASVPPFYYGFSFEEVSSYYRDLAASVSIPSMIYNIPSLTRRFSSDQFDELLQNEKIKYLKYTDTDYYMMEQIKAHHPDVFMYSGKDECFLSALSAGAEGAIGTTFNFMVPCFLEIQRLYRENKMQEALAVQHRVNEVVRALLDCGLFDGTKYAIKLASGIDCGNPRRPFHKLTEEQKTHIRTTMEANGML